MLLHKHCHHGCAQSRAAVLGQFYYQHRVEPFVQLRHSCKPTNSKNLKCSARTPGVAKEQPKLWSAPDRSWSEYCTHPAVAGDLIFLSHLKPSWALYQKRTTKGRGEKPNWRSHWARWQHAISFRQESPHRATFTHMRRYCQLVVQFC